jgi:hypothetical protein
MHTPIKKKNVNACSLPAANCGLGVAQRGIRVPCGCASACGVAQHALQAIEPHGKQKD